MNEVEAVFKAKENLVNYRYILLVTGDDEVEPAYFHYDWSDILLETKENVAIESFRESGKTQYILRSFLLYCLTFPNKKRDYIVLIKNNTTLARNKLREIETEYTTNPAISLNLKKIHIQSQDVFSVDVEDELGEIINVRIEAYGKGASIRGLANVDRRPKICIIDDPQDIEDAESITVQENDWNWFLSDVMFLGQHTRIFLIGNNLGEACIAERVFINAKELGFKIKKIPIIIDEKSAWPAKYTIEDIAKEKENFRMVGKMDVWLREKMCEATSQESRIFNKDDYRRYNFLTIDKLITNCRVWATLDPASSKGRESCYRAIVINAVDQDNNWFIIDIPYGRWDSNELIDILFAKVAQWKLKQVGIEKGMFKQIIEPFIYKEMSARKTFFNIIPVEHAKQGTKLERIKMLQPRFKAHKIWFPEHADWLAELENELEGVTKNAIKSLYIDLVDALAMQEQIAQPPSGIIKGNLPRQAKTEYEIFSH